MSWYAGNVTFTDVVAQPSQWGGSSASLTAIFIALSIFTLFAVFRSSSNNEIHNLSGSHLMATWAFFTKRYDFMQDQFNKTGLKMFSFRVLQHRMIAMAGEENRKIFFNDRNLDLSGYRILLGGLPDLDDINVDGGLHEDVPMVIKRLTLLLHRDRVKDLLPLLLEDIHRKMKDWGTEGKMDAFNEIYDLVFQMTVRMATCRELSENAEVVRQLARNYWEVEKNGTPVVVLLPWLPSSAKRMKKQATKALYTTLLSYVEGRRKSSTPSMDPIDFFISEGMSDDATVEYIVAIIAAGVVNTGINSSWALLHLGTNPKWKRKVIDEYKALVYNHTDTTSSSPLHARLATIPLDAWENELPSMDVVIRETLRISGSGTLLRRNVGKDIQIGKATIKRGDFLAYAPADVNLNPNIYKNPMEFDPDRYGPGREEDRKEAFGYLSWGAGRHPCAGMKIAKLEIKVVLAMFLLGFEYELVDGNGNHPKSVPDQDRNNLLQSRPTGDPCYLKYKRTVE